MAWLFGCGLISLALFSLLWLGLPLSNAVIALSMISFSGWFITHRDLLKYGGGA